MSISCISRPVSSEGVIVEDLVIHFMHGGCGAPLVLLHGGGNDWREWESNLAGLSGSLEVFALDFPGFGLSEAPRYPVNPSWSVDFLGEFMDALGLDGVSLMGQSLGGLISTAFALEHPERVKKLVLVDSAGLGRMSPTGTLLSNFFRSLAIVKRDERGPKYLPGPGLQVAGRLSGLKMPVLIVWGEKDQYFPAANAEAARGLIPNSELRIFAGCRHAPQREDPAMFNILVSNFLKA